MSVKLWAFSADFLVLWVSFVRRRCSAHLVRPPAGRRTARRPGLLEGDVTAGNVTRPPGVPPARPAQEPIY